MNNKPQSVRPVVRVAINAPLSTLFDYLLPDGQAASPGVRVRVPFGRRSQVGMVLEIAGHSDLAPDKLREVNEVIDREPLLSKTDLWLIRFTSDYYHHPIGEVVAAALPAALRQGKSVASTVQRIAPTQAGIDADLEILGKRAPRQAELLERVIAAEDVSFATLDKRMPGWRRVRSTLIGKDLLREYTASEETVAPDDLIDYCPDGNGPGGHRPDTAKREKGPPLNVDQRNALRAIRSATEFKATLIDGVTGSGKTEVYLHLIEDQIAANRQVLVVVPEIGLTPQLVERFERRLGFAPALLHSGLTDTARLSAWRRARNGSAPLVVGTRSAIFTPLQDPGLIIIDEEHDGSLKQQEGLRYSARDLAVARAKQLNIPIVLGSATPSLDTLQRCRDGGYATVFLPTRAGNAVAPLTRMVDLTRFDAYEGLSDPVISAIEKNITQNGQVLIYLNRRGFAPTLICSGCGVIAECTRCDSRMTVHAGSSLLKCHHCGAQRGIDTQCSTCGSQCRPLGHGTERLEQVLLSHFPQEVITRIDSDSTRLKGTMSKALAMATSGEARILVGTQMLSKGHHFPNLTLVVVINADQGLFSTDFRGGERLAQNLIQVSGRSGREERQGEVIIQTAFPEHPFWRELARGGYAQVAERELAERETAVWPPFSRLALLRASAPRREDAHAFLEHARGITAQVDMDGVRVLGPVSAPMERKAGRYRAQLLLQSRQRTGLHKLLGTLRRALEESKAGRRVRWSVDVDPIELF